MVQSVDEYHLCVSSVWPQRVRIVTKVSKPGTYFPLVPDRTSYNKDEDKEKEEKDKEEEKKKRVNKSTGRETGL